MRAEGFSCSLDVLYGGPGISKFLIEKSKKMSAVFFFSSIFGHQNPGCGLDPDSLEMLDPDRYPDPHWYKVERVRILILSNIE